MKIASVILIALSVTACRATPPTSPGVPPGPVVQNEEPRPQVLIAPAEQHPLSNEPGGPLAPITEAERREILRNQTPVFTPYTPMPDPVVVARDKSVWQHVRDFPLFHTLAYAGL